jgi:hypothetical protein
MVAVVVVAPILVGIEFNGYTVTYSTVAHPATARAKARRAGGHYEGNSISRVNAALSGVLKLERGTKGVA